MLYFIKRDTMSDFESGLESDDSVEKGQVPAYELSRGEPVNESEIDPDKSYNLLVTATAENLQELEHLLTLRDVPLAHVISDESGPIRDESGNNGVRLLEGKSYQRIKRILASKGVTIQSISER